LFNILSQLPGDLEVVIGDQLAEIQGVTREDDLLILEAITTSRERPSTTKFLTQAEEQQES
jgi:hypothetical protein